MRILFALTLLSIPLFSFAQASKIKKPEYVILLDGNMVTKEKLDDIGAKGLIKSLNKGVTQQFRDSLANIYGSKIGDKEFVITVSTLSAQELESRKVSNKDSEKAKVQKKKTNPFLVSVNESAPDFNVTMIDGTQKSLSEHKGSVVLLNFWATWCAPCLMEFYDMPEEILTPLKDQDFVFLPISIGEEKSTVVSKIEKLRTDGVVIQSGLDPDQSIFNTFAQGSIPKSILIDKNGVVRYTIEGYERGSLALMAERITALLNE